MQKPSSESFPLVVVIAILALVYVGKIIFDNLVHAWLMDQLGRHVGISAAEVIAGFFSITLPLLAAIAIVVGFHFYLKRELTRQLTLKPEDIPQLTPENLHLAPTFTETGAVAKYIRVQIRNTSSRTAVHCSAKLIKIEFQENGDWRTLAYDDALEMAWSNRTPGAKEPDLSPAGVDTLDLAFVVAGSSEIHIASIIQAHYPGLMGLAGDYRFTFELTSFGAGSRTVGLRAGWDLKAVVFPSDPLEFD